MKLEFSLLVIDDSPDDVGQAIRALKDHLEEKGFTLNGIYVSALLKQRVDELAQKEGRNYDLVMIDYNLGNEEFDGADAVLRLRNHLRFTEMLFYSSDPALNLYEKLQGQKISGVFIEPREDLDTALTGLADTVIGKAVDLNHTRGIAMAEVAEMDILMEETLRSAFQSDNRKIVDAGKRTIEKLRDSNKKETGLIEELYGVGGLPDVVGNGRIFSSTHKFWAVRRLAKLIREKVPSELEALKSYQGDIIDNRNLLAHAKEELTQDGEVVLRSIKSDGAATRIDENWMTDFRLKLRGHREALTSVCTSLKAHFAPSTAVHDTQQSQP